MPFKQHCINIWYYMMIYDTTIKTFGQGQIQGGQRTPPPLRRFSVCLLVCLFVCFLTDVLSTFESIFAPKDITEEIIKYIFDETYRNCV